MIDVSKFKPLTVYVTYIAATPNEVWRALTEAEFTRQYFGGFAVEVEPKWAEVAARDSDFAAIRGEPGFPA